MDAQSSLPGFIPLSSRGNMISLKIGGIIVAAFVAGSFVASPELRAYAANTVFSTDIKDGEVKTPDLANNAVTSVKIKDGDIKTDDIAPSAIGSLRIKDNDVKSQDLAADSVGASEVIGVTKLVFTACSISDPMGSQPGSGIRTLCPVTGMTMADRAIVTKEFGNPCYSLTGSEPRDGAVFIFLKNICTQTEAPGIETFSVIVYRPG
jgi:hypothetical protein